MMNSNDVSEDDDDIEKVATTNLDYQILLNPPQEIETDVNEYPQNPYGNREMHSSLFFKDGLRAIDFVFVWKKTLITNENDQDAMLKREVFEENLEREGLEIERTIIDELNFVKIHAPLDVLRRYAEILKFRMPMKEVRINLSKTLL